MSVDSEFKDLTLKNRMSKFILQTFCLVFISDHFKMFVNVCELQQLE